MVSRQTKLRYRRMFRRRRKQAIDLGTVTENNLDKYVMRRLVKLVQVRRFLIGWVSLVLLLSVGVALQSRALSSFYTEEVPIAGGTYREGIVGTFTNANPIYAQTEVDSAASRLLFSGLFTYDTAGNLKPDLAEKYELDPTETIYTVTLKDNIFWHDSQPITAKDVVYTYKTIQNPEAKSYLAASWKGIDVVAKGEKTVVFTLSNSLSAFPYSLTTGILPEHILGKVDATELRSVQFNNQNPIGSGPFIFRAVEVDDEAERGATRVAFAANPNYHLGTPKLDQFILRTYVSEENLRKAFDSNEVDAMAGLQSLPDDIEEGEAQVYAVPLAGEVMVFFKNSQKVLQDANVRKALVLGIDKNAIYQSLPTTVLSVDSPLLRSQIGYDKTYAQVTNDKAQAVKVLEEAGWKQENGNGVRKKDGQELRFKLFTTTSSEFAGVAGELQRQWRELGVEAEVVMQPEADLQTTISSHNYDALIYGVLIGSDPDVYAYWHSTQGDVRSPTRLNLSEYKSDESDKALEAGRTRSDPEIRAVKYRPFLAAWQKDNPALALYQPRYLYITNNAVQGFDYGVLQSSSDRYITVTEWTVRTGTQTKD